MSVMNFSILYFASLSSQTISHCPEKYFSRELEMVLLDRLNSKIGQWEDTGRGLTLTIQTFPATVQLWISGRED